MFASVPINPKNSDGILRIISIGRLSKPKDSEDATQLSLEAIRSENARLLATIYKGPTSIAYLAEQISGLIPERETMNQLWQLVETGEWDLIVAEDLSRVFRNPRWQWAFVQDCVDARIRVIIFADSIDTASENWETNVAVATLRHGLTIPDTRRRIKRTATESFKNGGMVGKIKAFYAKLTREEAASGIYGPKDLRMRKLSEYVQHDLICVVDANAVGQVSADVVIMERSYRDRAAVTNLGGIQQQRVLVGHVNHRERLRFAWLWRRIEVENDFLCELVAE